MSFLSKDKRLAQADVAEIWAEATGSTDNRSIDRIVKEGRLLVTQELARRILNECPYERQRKSFPHHIKLLADLMRREKFSPGSQIAFGRLDGRLHMVNGKHRMHGVIEAKRTVEFQVLIVDCADEAELDKLYYRFDVAQRHRSVAEILRASEVAEHHGLSKTMAKATYDAVALIANGMMRPNYQTDPVKARSIDARLDAAQGWWSVAALYEAAIASAPSALKGKLLNQGAAAVGLVTFRYQPEIAEEFWRGLAENDGLKKGDPRATLIQDLYNRRLNAGAASQAAASVAHAWNAFFNKRRLKIIKIYPDSKVTIAGTPFDGRRK